MRDTFRLNNFDLLREVSPGWQRPIAHVKTESSQLP